MGKFETVRPRDIFMGTLTCGSDLLEELTKLYFEYNVRLGRVEGIGAVQRARFGFYDQSLSIYRFNNIDHPLEITNLTGVYYEISCHKCTFYQNL